jgi:hypothetical protein
LNIVGGVSQSLRELCDECRTAGVPSRRARRDPPVRLSMYHCAGCGAWLPTAPRQALTDKLSLLGRFGLIAGAHPLPEKDDSVPTEQ